MTFKQIIIGGIRETWVQFFDFIFDPIITDGINIFGKVPYYIISFTILTIYPVIFSLFIIAFSPVVWLATQKLSK